MINSILDVDSLISIAYRLLREDKYIEVLDTISRIDKTKVDFDKWFKCVLIRTSAYNKMKLSDLAFEMLISEYVDNPCGELYLAVTFFSLNNEDSEATSYYLSEGVDKGYFEGFSEFLHLITVLGNDIGFSFEDEFIDVDDDDYDYDDDYRPDIKLVNDEEQEYEENLEISLMMFARGDDEYALEVLAGIPPTFKDLYNFARCRMANYHLTMSDDLDKPSALLADPLLDSDMLPVCMSRLILAHKQGNKDKVDEILATLSVRQGLALVDYAQIVLVLGTIERYEEMYAYCLRILAIDRYAIEILIKAGIALYHLDRRDEARGYFVTVLSIMPNHYYAKRYSQLMAIDDISSSDIDDVEMHFDTTISRLIDQKSTMSEWEVNREAVEWHIKTSHNKSVHRVISILIKQVRWHGIFRDLLLSSRVDRFVKKQIVFGLVKKHLPTVFDPDTMAEFAKKSPYVLIDKLLYKIRFECISEFRNSNKSIIVGFFDAYTAIALAKIDIYDELVSKLRRIIVALNYYKDKVDSPQTVAAICASYAGRLNIFGTDRECIEFFGCTKSRFDEYKGFVKNHKLLKKNGGLASNSAQLSLRLD